MIGFLIVSRHPFGKLIGIHLSYMLSGITLVIYLFTVIGLVSSLQNAPMDNINGTFQVRQNFHYSNKTTIEWGHNSQLEWSVLATLPIEAATYNCSNTSEYFCEDPAWMFDWNKLWGKARCGYAHDHHEDSDRFVWRRCSDVSCAAYDGSPKIQIGAYSYDGGVAPYTGEKPQLLQEFKTTIPAATPFKYGMIMNDQGLTTFMLSTAEGVLLETQLVQHDVWCADNYFEGTVQGLYFGGTCRAPATVVVAYQS